VLLLQWLAGRHWTRVAAGLALVVIVLSPLVWTSGIAAGLPEAIRPYLDNRTGSRFPIFPFSAFVLAGTLAGATLGRAEPGVRHRRAVWVGAGLLVLGGLVAWALRARWGFWWGASPGYVVVRLGGLILLIRLIEMAANARGIGTRLLALLGHETLLVYVLHLYLLFGGLCGASPLMAYAGRLSAPLALGVLLAMLPPLAAVAWLWRAAKQRAPREAQLGLVFLSVAFLYEYFTRPW
jgi:hypothetical protein